MIRFACPCGRQLQARDEDVGKDAQCPSCGAVVVVAAEGQAGSSAVSQGVYQGTPPAPDEGERHRHDDGRDSLPAEHTSGKAVGALVCGLTALFLGVTAVPGLILGVLALRDIRKSKGELGGRGAAIAGVVLSCFSIIGLAVFLPAVWSVRSTVERLHDVSNLKQIGLAVHNLAAAYDGLPQAAPYTDANGKPLLSWRVALLPYVEQDALFTQFKFDEPWDSPHNKALIPLMPKIYALPGDRNSPDSGLTYYQVFVGPRSAFEPRKRQGPWAPGGLEVGWKFDDFTDGMSETLLIVTAKDPVIWTKPEDLAFTPDGPLPALGGHRSFGYHVVVADGSVRPLPQTTPEATLRALVTRNCGEKVALPWLP